MPKTISLSDENIKLLESLREYKRETWDDLFNKIKEVFKRQKR